MRRLTPKLIAGAVEALCERDDDLAAIVKRHGPPPVRLRKPGFETLAQIIVEQQVTLASGQAIWRRLVEELGGVTPQIVGVRSVAHLRTLGLSRQKASYVHGIALAVTGGVLSFPRVHRADDEDARRQLTQLHGVGRWTADIYLLTAMGRPDVWPRGDLALETALAWLKGLDGRPGPDMIEEHTERWAPWRSVAARILWHGYVKEVKGG